MRKINQNKHIEEDGAAIIEATLFLTTFIILIFTILGFINLCRAQAMISEAVDATAKEMSQYAYFYQLSGLADAAKNEYKQTEADREKFDNIVDSVSAVYNSLNSAEVQEVTGKVTSALNGETNLEGIEDSIISVVENAEQIENFGSNVNKLAESFSNVTDPLGFCKSMLTVAALEGVDRLKSRLIAAPMAKALIKKHFEASGMSADDYLRTFRIDGMDALNFNMSNIFDMQTPEEIHIVVYYEMDILNFFNFDIGTVVLRKEAATRAWLGGDGRDEDD